MMGRRFTVLLLLFALSPLQPLAGDAGIEQKVRLFLDRFIDADKTPSEQVALFADEVEYYDHGIVGREHILHDVERYVRHWPQRNYRLEEISYISEDPTSDRVFVAYTVDYEVANRDKTLSGKATYGAVIDDLDTSPKVESIKEKITERKRDGK